MSLLLTVPQLPILPHLTLPPRRFLPWPEEALTAVSGKFIDEFPMACSNEAKDALKVGPHACMPASALQALHGTQPPQAAAVVDALCWGSSSKRGDTDCTVLWLQHTQRPTPLEGCSSFGELLASVTCNIMNGPIAPHPPLLRCPLLADHDGPRAHVRDVLLP